MNSAKKDGSVSHQAFGGLAWTALAEDQGKRAGMAGALGEVLGPGETRDQLMAAIKAASTSAEARIRTDAILTARRSDIRQSLAEMERERSDLETYTSELAELVAWLTECPGAPLSSVKESQLHQALGSIQRGPALGPDDEFPPSWGGAPWTTFLIQHDWAAVMFNAAVDDGEIRLPADYCTFECAVYGRRVCFFAECENGSPRKMGILFKGRSCWIGGQWKADIVPEVDRLASLVWGHVRAIAIMLDAEVVEADVVRAPYALNVRRLKARKLPIFDHHVISLVRRAVARSLETHESTGARRRLHFRRGHWRHYPSHKTWIKWCLVGDAELGFVDKDYRV